MKFRTLSISNFKTIKIANLEDLPNMVVIAGPNGCGKSTIFDAIRLLKSVYGGYQQNEWQQWFNEFQVSLDVRHPEYLSLLQDTNKPISITAEITLSASEKDFLKSNLNELLRKHYWNQFVPETNHQIYGAGSSIAAQLQQFEPQVEEMISSVEEDVLQDLSKDLIFASLRIPNDLKQRITINNSVLLQIVCSQFDPQNIGILDYHGPQRTYQREQVGGVNLNIETTEQQTSQSALYNYNGKYSNIKSELAASYIRDLIAEKSGKERNSGSSLIETLKELFSTFFPGKHFNGPVPTTDGRLSFPVYTDSGIKFDINDLSSGEKEILYGYLRLYNLSPRNSTLLLDEPELHLNPRLVRGLPQFYQKHLSDKLDNQIWLLTHSDAMLREALQTENTKVFHMLPAENIIETENQIRLITAADETEKAIIDLVGDLATYKPGAKLVVFEGGGDTEFDVQMVTTLFPEFEKNVNQISGGGKYRVRNLHALLAKANETGVFPIKVFSINDKDSDKQGTNNDNALTWDVYHIENYLLDTNSILQALNDLESVRKRPYTLDEIEEYLLNCAKETMNGLIIHLLREDAYMILKDVIDLGIDPNSKNISESLFNSITRLTNRMNKDVQEKLTIAKLRVQEEKMREEFVNDLSSGEWRKTFRGREILKKFTNQYCNNIPYESFRNLILARMRDNNYRPEGMKTIINKILSA